MICTNPYVLLSHFSEILVQIMDFWNMNSWKSCAAKPDTIYKTKKSRKFVFHSESTFNSRLVCEHSVRARFQFISWSK